MKATEFGKEPPKNVAIFKVAVAQLLYSKANIARRQIERLRKQRVNGKENPKSRKN